LHFNVELRDGSNRFYPCAPRGLRTHSFEPGHPLPLAHFNPVLYEGPRSVYISDSLLLVCAIRTRHYLTTLKTARHYSLIWTRWSQYLHILFLCE